MSYSTLGQDEPGALMARGKVRTEFRCLQDNPLSGISLLKRRRWFADDPPPEDPNKQPGAATGDGAKDPDPNTAATDVKDLPAWAQKLLEDTRKEAAENRAKFRKQEEETAKAAQKAAEEQGQFKQLWDGAQPQLEELKTLREREAARREQVKQANEKRIAELPKEKKAIVEGLIGKMGTDDPEKVADVLNDLLPSLVAQTPAPEMDAGTKGDKKGTSSGKVTLNRVSY